MEYDKKCDCTHSRYDHIIVHKKMTKLAYLDKGIFLTHQLDHGKCKKCTCPKFEPPRLYRSKRNMEYHSIPMDVIEDSEKRCRKCGTLFERHSEINHPFQDNIS